jgi:single-strand DNA-binding protein
MSFSVADSKSRKLDSGEWETLAEQWLECTIWGSLAEFYDGKLTKGSRVTVYGDFMSRKYEAKDGSTGTSLDVNVKGVDIMPSKKGNQQQGGGFGGNKPAVAQEDPWATPGVSNSGSWGSGPDSEPPF